MKNANLYSRKGDCAAISVRRGELIMISVAVRRESKIQRVERGAKLTESFARSTQSVMNIDRWQYGINLKGFLYLASGKWKPYWRFTARSMEPTYLEHAWMNFRSGLLTTARTCGSVCFTKGLYAVAILFLSSGFWVAFFLLQCSESLAFPLVRHDRVGLGRGGREKKKTKQKSKKKGSP